LHCQHLDRVRNFVRRTASIFGPALAIVALTQLEGCDSTHPAYDQQGPDPRAVISNREAFEKQPNLETWEPLRAELLKTPTGQVVESSVQALTEQAVPERLLNAGAVDLAAADWPGTMKWVREYNVASTTDPSARGRQMVSGTAHLAWLMLALRANYVRDAVDLSHTDLRDDARFIGQAMNLANVDFSASRLSGGTWRNANVGGALFAGATIAGELRCISCSFGSLRYPGTLTLINGQWVSR
jgi:hypothetical protein